jgi:hypothetical protein
MAFFTLFINATLSLYRSKLNPATAIQPHHYPLQPNFPPQHFGGYLSPAPTPAWGRSSAPWKLEGPNLPAVVEQEEGVTENSVIDTPSKPSGLRRRLDI